MLLNLANGGKNWTKEEIQERLSSEVQPVTDGVAAPSFLSAKQRKEFDRIAAQLQKLNIMGETDVDALARYVTAQTLYELTSKKMRTAMRTMEDLEAADRAMQIIQSKPQGEGMLDALRIVYMSKPDRTMKRGEIAARAQAAAEEIHVDIATVYRWLWMARRLFAQERGLRVKDASSAGV